MTLKVHISPTPDMISLDNGIGQIVHAQYKYLSQFGIELVPPDEADVIACHIEQGALPQVDVLHVHGLYYADLPHAPYSSWHHTANMKIAASARRALAITVPSEWVAEAFKRDMRITPTVIPHGIDLSAWQPAEPKGYVLWNKGRGSDVCNPMPAYRLAEAGIPVVTTFAPPGMPDLPMLHVTGPLPHEQMKELIRHASVYLATTPETFGIGTLEAMACGVPVLGYDWCGTRDIVSNAYNGYLVPSGDIEMLITAYYKLRHTSRQYVREMTRIEDFAWPIVMQQYAALYQDVADQKAREQHRVSVVVTAYNYGEYIDTAVRSLIDQEYRPDEIILVNDGSSDSTTEEIEEWVLADPWDQIKSIHQENQGVAAARNNGIAAATGDYIICLDADDQLAPEYIKVCRDALKADRGLGIAYTGLGIMQSNGSVAPSPFPPDFDWNKQAEPHNPPATTIPTAAMFRRSLWERAGGYKQVHAPGEDAEFYTRGLSIGYTARKVAAESFIHYRIHDGSASRTKQYKPVDAYLPWMRDKQFPFAAPITRPVPVRSYALPLVSVIIPVGPGHAQYLPTALDSLLGQTFRQWEVIVVDDLGPDGIPDSIFTPYPFVRLFENRPYYDRDAGPFGVANARNVGLQEARAPLCLFLDADDWLLPEALAQMVERFQETGKYVYGHALAYDGTSEPTLLRAPDYSQSGWWTEDADGKPLMHHSITALLPTEWARSVQFDETLPGWEEQFFYAEFARRGYCGVLLDTPIIGYRLHTGQRRNDSFDHADELHAIRHARYEGVTAMGCCGNIDLQRRSLEMTEEQWNGTDVPEGQTLVEYTGARLGSVSYSMVNGQELRGKYRFSAADESRYNPVYDEDLERLLSLGDFQIVQQPKKAAKIAKAAADVPDAPAATQPVAGLEANAQAVAMEAVQERNAQRGRKAS